MGMKNIFYLFLICFTAMLVGGCTPGFYAVSGSGIYRIDSAGRAKLTLDQTGVNYLIADRSRGLYYASGNGQKSGRHRHGELLVLKAGPGGLEVLQKTILEEHTPVHIALAPDGRTLYAANYSQGDICELDLDEAGFFTGKMRFIAHSGRSIKRRQRSPHPHYCGFDPQGRGLFVCDLGTDHVYIYEYTPGQGIGTLCSEKLALAPGAGPRHMIFDRSGKVFYCANELDSTVSCFVKKAGRWQLLKTLSTLKKTHTAAAQNYPGAIKLTADGRFLLVTNRGDDSISLFAVDGSGGIELIENISSGGSYPGDIHISEYDKYVAISNLKSGNVTIFTLDKAQKKLLFTDNKANIVQARALCGAIR